MRQIILASASPRRSQLLSQVGIPFEVMPSSYEEKLEKEGPKEAVMKLAYGKAKDVLDRLEDGQIVLGADTVVACDDRILGKPANEQVAFEMLKMLSGRSHYVYTGVALLERKNGEILEKIFCEETRVDFAEISDEDIKEYLRSGECMDKAGSYAIQGRFAAHIVGICGDYNNVVGLPVGRVFRELRSF